MSLDTDIDRYRYLLKRYLLSLDDEDHYQDGLCISDRELAKDNVTAFLEWLIIERRNPTVRGCRHCTFSKEKCDGCKAEGKIACCPDCEHPKEGEEEFKL